MLISFLLFPRMIGPLWDLPKDASNAFSGISDTINLGLISNLALSKETAFRARFDEQSPPQNQLYWRGPVFWNTDGRQWQLSRSKTIATLPALNSATTPYSYSIVMDPHNQFWLYGLDAPIAPDKNVRLTEDRQLINNVKVTRNRSFNFISSTAGIAAPLSDADRKRALALPDATDSRVYTLADSWRNKGANPLDTINNGLAYFNNEQFYYTLTPPTLGDDPVAEFLFNTQRGFCGHYATSFAVVRRAAGIPARLIGGYQGGVYNQMGGFWEILQADAHVWVEAWVDGKGWLRVDPTAAISPNRIERAINLNNPIAGDEITFLLDSPEGFNKWKQQLTSVLQTIDYYWESGVLAYGPEVQGDFLANVGIEGWEDMIRWHAVLSGVFILLGALYLYRPSGQPKDRVQVRYLALCKPLAKKAGPRKLNETASDYLQRAIQHYPTNMDELEGIKALYLETRYGQKPGELFFASLKKLKL